MFSGKLWKKTRALSCLFVPLLAIAAPSHAVLISFESFQLDPDAPADVFVIEEFSATISEDLSLFSILFDSPLLTAAAGDIISFTVSDSDFAGDGALLVDAFDEFGDFLQPGSIFPPDPLIEIVTDGTFELLVDDLLSLGTLAVGDLFFIGFEFGFSTDATGSVTINDFDIGPPAKVPEPTTWTLLLVGLIGLFLLRSNAKQLY